ncbi:hypothetical protein IV38_GL001874 [Lactobacillus selangorensis]|uniref:N-acetyltransferase domain-containing protein n=1 Tax=Lactobacillus selangorensis TaxID=81857 RepID=A0A0R2FHD4_9LACO|nr:GNAT family N-acetyltransferase [Lactobacillus selangorensis]KRN27662.1 hypothetical protein IV38_GL001874 [Lactobacillus selangorensis]KRN30371.1 hypothetical protein IV40_GL001960 [Lactobacillus selangorensis]
MASEQLEITIREAVPDDAAALLKVFEQLNQETNFVVLTPSELKLTPETEAMELADLYDSDNNALFVALAGSQIIGLVRMTADLDVHTGHIGDLGIAVLKDYWHCGIGTALMETIMDWAEHSPLARLELTVQRRNNRAIALYERFGFETEALMERGYYDETDGYLPILLMSKLIH